MKITLREISKFRDAILSGNAFAVDEFLKKTRNVVFNDHKTLLGFHGALLLLCAYPPTEELYNRADELLNNFQALTRKFLRANRKAEAKLVNTGLGGTEIHGAFTYPLLNAFRLHAHDALFLHSFAEDAVSLADVMRHFIPASEFEVAATEGENEEVAEQLFGSEDHLQKILVQMETGSMSNQLRDELFERLKVFAGIRLIDELPNRSTARGVIHSVFTSTEILKKADPAEVLSRPLPAPDNLTHEQKQRMVWHAAVMLATLNRETDPVSYCDLQSLSLFQLDRGVSVMLCSMQPDMRLPLESYIGYMLYRNGIPLAYGGAWIFGNRALFGINIFEPFRGGESTLTILQLLRVYHQHYGVTAFSVEPYQFGKDNPEGIESGAYWFYYKLGFRSDDRKLAALAEKEFAKMKVNRSYRTSHAALRKFTESRITWKMDSADTLFPDPAEASRKITTMIRNRFLGDRVAAVREAMLHAEPHASGSLRDYALLYFAYGHAPAAFIKKAAELARLKLADEHQYNAYLSTLRADFQ